MGELRQSAVVVQVTDIQLILEVCRESTCKACAARSMCSAGSSDGSGGHLITLADDGMGRSVGDQVTVVVSERRAALAVAFAYLIPVLVVVGLLLIFQQMQVSELISGLVVLGVLALYFVAIKIFDKKIGKQLTITIE